MQYRKTPLPLAASVIILILLSGCASQPVTVSPDSKASISKASFSKKRSTVVKTVQEMIGASYRYGGNSPAGFDCSGLVWYSHKRAGINVPRTAVQQLKSASKISRKHMAPGDLLFFKIGWGQNYHVATYLGNGKFVHAPSSGKKVSVGSLDNPYWKKRLIRVGRYYR